MTKKILSIILVCIMAFSMSGISVSAAENEYMPNPAPNAIEITPFASGSGSTGKMNSINGYESAPWGITISAGSATVTTVTLNVTVSSGSDRMIVYVEAPNGSWASRTIGASGTLTFTEFRGIPASGKWYVSIQTLGTVSTATARLTVNY